MESLNEDDSLAAVSSFSAVRRTDGGCLHSIIKDQNDNFALSWEIFEEPDTFSSDTYTFDISPHEAAAIIAFYTGAGEN